MEGYIDWLLGDAERDAGRAVRAAPPRRRRSRWVALASSTSPGTPAATRRPRSRSVAPGWPPTRSAARSTPRPSCCCSPRRSSSGTCSASPSAPTRSTSAAAPRSSGSVRTFEGILRQHRPNTGHLTEPGTARDTAAYSILPAEWPAIRARSEGSPRWLTDRPVMLITGAGRGIGAAVARAAAAQRLPPGAELLRVWPMPPKNSPPSSARPVAAPSPCRPTSATRPMCCACSRRRRALRPRRRAGQQRRHRRRLRPARHRHRRHARPAVGGQHHRAVPLRPRGRARMRTDTGGRGGSIVNISSKAAVLGGPSEWVLLRRVEGRPRHDDRRAVQGAGQRRRARERRAPRTDRERLPPPRAARAASSGWRR